MPATPLTPAEIAALRSDMKAAATELREAYAAESESGDNRLNEMTYQCPHCRKKFSEETLGVIAQDLPKFGRVLYHDCPRSPWPNKRTRLSGADKALVTWKAGVAQT